MKLKCLLVLSAVLQLNLALESQVIIVEEDVLIPNEFDFNITVGSDDVKKQCPGGKTSCDTDQTCCEMYSGGYGCCPYKNAICCKDGKSCCPWGTKCDLVKLTCDINMTTSDDKIVNEINVKMADVEDYSLGSCPSPDPCSKDQTCCSGPEGNYGCCPYQNGICCSDGEHCCPANYECDMDKMQCIHRNDFNKAHTIPIVLQDNFQQPNEDYEVDIVEEDLKTVNAPNDCDDPKEKCPEGTTCCKLESGRFGCCPYNGAVCCKDGAHCCPHGTQCDIMHGRCVRGVVDILFHNFFPEKESNKFFELTPKQTNEDDFVEQEADFVNVLGGGSQFPCPNPEDQCLKGQTCCKIDDSEYGCCPLKNAVCCADRLHCCPEGTRCDPEQITCYNPKNNFTVSLIESSSYYLLWDEK